MGGRVSKQPKILGRLLTYETVAEVKDYRVSQETIRLDCADGIAGYSAWPGLHTLNLEHPSAEIGLRTRERFPDTRFRRSRMHAT